MSTAAEQNATRALLVAIVSGAAVSVVLGVYGAQHQPTFEPISTFGFDSMIQMKVWLAVAAGVLAVGQVFGALWMYGKLGIAAPSWLGKGHRTFGFLADEKAMRAAGLGRGASMANTLVVDAGRVVNPEGLRFEDEFVRHKMLDAVGDLAMAGAPICGRFVADQPGHALNALLVRALLSTPEAWCWVGESEVETVREPALAPVAAFG